MADPRADARESMVERQLVTRGIRDEAVLAAMRTVSREAFLPRELADAAYDDGPLPIGMNQTISQPYIVALMAEAMRLTGSERVLEIGSGCGYSAAILSRIAREVFTVERHEALADSAAMRLRELGFDNVSVRHGDGTLGWPEQAPFDAIMVAASGPKIPETLIAQLTVGGRLVIPIGDDKGRQTLVRVTRRDDGSLREEHLEDVRFVPLIGAEAWEDDE